MLVIESRYIKATYGVRKNGSTDTLTGELGSNESTWIAIGVDTNDIMEVYISTKYMKIYIIGYIPNEAGVFFTNKIDKSISTTETYTDIDISTDTDADTAKIAFLIIHNPDINYTYKYKLRENGSTDNLSIRISIKRIAGACISCDTNEIFEGYIENTYVKFYLVGYIKTGYAESWANAKDYSTTTTGSWVDTDVSTDVPNNSNGAFFVVENTEFSVTYHGFGARKNGSSWNVIGYTIGQYGWTAVDINRIFEQYIADTTLVLYIWGYVKSAPPPPPPVKKSPISHLDKGPHPKSRATFLGNMRLGLKT